MSEFFLKIVNMSISASWIVLAVLLLRLLFRKAPKWITVLLWGIVAIRLICPFTIESVLSLIPNPETVSPEIMMDATPGINTGVPIINQVVNPVIAQSFAPSPAASANPLQILIPVLSNLWLVGIAGMLLYTAISYCKVKWKIGTAVRLRDNIFQSENVVSPFVLGIVKPKIYLPFDMNEQDMSHVIAHEQAHIHRKDHLWKPFGFLILTIHWFNPLLWLGYVLLCRDIELACDEKVVKEFDPQQKADYSQALLTCSVNRPMIAACPLAFGEVGVKKRVRSVLHYKKPAFWIILVAVIASVVTAICFLTDPKISADEKPKEYGSSTTNVGGVDGGSVQAFESTVSYANWAEESRIYAGALNKEKMAISSVLHLPIYRFDTLADLEQFKETFGDTFTMDAGWDEVPSFRQATAKYGSAFFESNSLLLVYVSANNGTHRFKVQSVGYDETSFCVHVVETTNAEAVDTAMAGWFVTIAVPDELIQNCTEFDADLDNAINLLEETGVDDPNYLELYEPTPTDEVQTKYDTEEIVYLKSHYMAADGTWFCEGYSYQFRLEITGRLHNAAKNTTYVVLSNSKDITFEQTWKASGLSSLMSDYFDPADAVIVGHKSFS